MIHEMYIFHDYKRLLFSPPRACAQTLGGVSRLGFWTVPSPTLGATPGATGATGATLCDTSCNILGYFHPGIFPL